MSVLCWVGQVSQCEEYPSLFFQGSFCASISPQHDIFLQNAIVSVDSLRRSIAKSRGVSASPTMAFQMLIVLLISYANLCCALGGHNAFLRASGHKIADVLSDAEFEAEHMESLSAKIASLVPHIQAGGQHARYRMSDNMLCVCVFARGCVCVCAVVQVRAYWSAPHFNRVHFSVRLFVLTIAKLHFAVPKASCSRRDEVSRRT